MAKQLGTEVLLVPAAVGNFHDIAKMKVLRIALIESVVLQLSATDVSAQATMKGAAKCDKHCELQNSVNQQELERTLRFRDIPESMPASASNSTTAGDAVHHRWARRLCVLVRSGASCP